MLKYLSLIATIFLIGGCFPSNEKIVYNNTIEMLGNDTLIMRSHKPTIDDEVISIINEKLASCVTTQDRSYLQFSLNNDRGIPFDLVYLDNRKVGVERCNARESNFESLEAIEEEIGYYSVFKFVALDSKNSLLLSKGDGEIVLHKIQNGRLVNSQKALNAEGLYPINLNGIVQNTSAHIRDGKVLTMAGGEFDRSDESSRFFAWIDTNTLEIIPIDFRIKHLGKKLSRLKGNNVQVNAFLDDYWLRIDNDSVCYSLLNPSDTMVLKGFSDAQIAHYDSIKAENNLPIFSMYMKPTWSDVFLLDEINKYAVVGLLPSLEGTKGNKLNLSFSSFIDLYDMDMNHQQRISIEEADLSPPVYGSGNSIFMNLNCSDCQLETKENEEIVATFLRMELDEVGDNHK